MPDSALYLGIDLGTSGARAVVIDGTAQQRAMAKADYTDHGGDLRTPQVWWDATMAALDGVLSQIDPAKLRALAVDGTSGTMLALDAGGAPLGEGLLYNDPCPDPDVLKAIGDYAPKSSAAHGPTSGAARAVMLQRRYPVAARLVHQSDWIASRFSGRLVSDANNSLKTGYDPVAACWPDWLAAAGVPAHLLPPVVEPGTDTGPATVAPPGIPADARVIAGTTDGCASFLATGAMQPGDGVTALGTTLTIKLLSDQPIFAPRFGIYSHRLLGMWLAGGASNSGGAALLAHFTPEQIATLSDQINPETASGLDYYPLPAAGERFPIADPALAPRISPRPAEDAHFLHGLFEGIAAVEALGYSKLAELGAPPLRSLRSLGGGAANPVWSRLRQRRLGVPFELPRSFDAAYGTAVLALRGGCV